SVGDLGLSPGDEIVVAPGPGNGNPPTVKVFDSKGQKLLSFTVESFTKGWGASVAVSCGRVLVAPGPGPNVPQQVVEFDPHGNKTREWVFAESGFVNSIKACGTCGGDKRSLAGPEEILIWGSEIAVNDSRIGIYNTKTKGLRWIEILPTTFGASVTTVRLAAGGCGCSVSRSRRHGNRPV